MAIYRSNKKTRNPKEQLIQDIADILTGPTSGAEAHRLATLLVESAGGEEVARRLLEVGDRYFACERFFKG